MTSNAAWRTQKGRLVNKVDIDFNIVVKKKLTALDGYTPRTIYTARIRHRRLHRADLWRTYEVDKNYAYASPTFLFFFLFSGQTLCYTTALCAQGYTYIGTDYT